MSNPTALQTLLSSFGALHPGLNEAELGEVVAAVAMLDGQARANGNAILGIQQGIHQLIGVSEMPAVRMIETHEDDEDQAPKKPANAAPQQDLAAQIMRFTLDAMAWTSRRDAVARGRAMAALPALSRAIQASGDSETIASFSKLAGSLS